MNRYAKLIDYKFVLDLDFNSRALEYITHGQVMVSKQLKQINCLIDSWINKHWKTDYRVKNNKEYLLLKDKNKISIRSILVV